MLGEQKDGGNLENKNKISLSRKVFYGFGDIYGGGAFLIIGALFLFFLTDVAGFDPIVAGLIIGLGKIWDAVTDPAMGYISDHTKSRFGRRRIYFLVGTLPIIISFALLWVSFSFSHEGIKFLYYLFTYMLFGTVFTMVMVPYNAMPAEMSQDYQQRSSLIGVRMAFSQFAALLGALLPMTIVNAFEDKNTGFAVMGLMFGGLYGLSIFMVFLGTKEEPDKGQVLDRPVGLWKTLMDLFKVMGSTFKNKSLRIHIAMYLSAYVAMDLFNALMIYYLRDYLHRESYYQVLLGIVLLSQLLSLFFVARSCSRIGNARTYRRHTMIWLTGIVIFGLMTAESPLWLLFIIGILIGTGLAGGVMVPYNMLAFVVDADEMMTSKRREGTYAGMMTFVRKMAQALALFSVGVYLDLIGYRPGLVASTATVLGIRLFFAIAPTLLIVLGIISSYRFKITPKNHGVLLGEIDRLKEGGHKSQVTAETKNIVEAITGLSYATLWMKEKRVQDESDRNDIRSI